MSDAQAFLGSYKETLDAQATEDFPSEWLSVYDFESCLKHCGGKEVYLVTDRRTGAHVILRASDLDTGERADAEHNILARLNHPGVPRTFGTITRDGRSYLAREYLPGESLDQVVARGTFGFDAIVAFTDRLCDILGYLHSQQPPVIHRDIKPQNIIMRPDGRLGLTDFGIARTFKTEASSDTHYAGTLPYAPPEQYGYAQSTPQTDIYALGIVLVYLATGSADRQNLQARVSDRRLLALIERCIAFDPADRFANVEQIRRFLAGLRARRLRRGLGIGAAALVLVLLAGGGIWLATHLLGGGVVVSGTSSISTAATDNGGAGNAGVGDEGEHPALLLTPSVDNDGWLYDYEDDGNLPGNIAMGGFAVADPLEHQELYLSFGGRLYATDMEGANPRVLREGSTAIRNLNYHAGLLYFSDSGGLHCLDPASAAASGVIDSPVDKAWIVGGQLYYTSSLDQLNLYGADLDGGSKQMLVTDDRYFDLNIIADAAYFFNSSDRNRIYRASLANVAAVPGASDAATGIESSDASRAESGIESGAAPLAELRADALCNFGARLYFSDADRFNALRSCALDGTDVQLLSDDPYYGVNVCARGVFALCGLDQSLRAMNGGGGKARIVIADKVASFCLAGDWVFYYLEGDRDTLHMCRLDGSDDRVFMAE
jgi:hypothetical protein